MKGAVAVSAGRPLALGAAALVAASVAVALLAGIADALSAAGIPLARAAAGARPAPAARLGGSRAADAPPVAGTPLALGAASSHAAQPTGLLGVRRTLALSHAVPEGEPLAVGSTRSRLGPAVAAGLHLGGPRLARAALPFALTGLAVGARNSGSPAAAARVDLAGRHALTVAAGPAGHTLADAARETDPVGAAPRAGRGRTPDRTPVRPRLARHDPPAFAAGLAQPTDVDASGPAALWLAAPLFSGTEGGHRPIQAAIGRPFAALRLQRREADPLPLTALVRAAAKGVAGPARADLNPRVRPGWALDGLPEARASLVDETLDARRAPEASPLPGRAVDRTIGAAGSIGTTLSDRARARWTPLSTAVRASVADLDPLGRAAFGRWPTGLPARARARSI